MSRLLFLLAVIIVVYLLLKSYRSRPTPKSEEKTAVPEEMVRCVHCGVHLPKSESILAGGQFYCSEAHRREHTSK
jgi:uncharacterized protein